MTIDRRQLMIGGACLLAAAGAEALRPRRRLSLLGKAELETITPHRFGTWVDTRRDDVIQPLEEDSLSAKLYSQVLGRVYRDSASGEYVLLSLAYGDTQSDLLQLHRPESCYPAFGFTLSQNQRTQLNLIDGVNVPTRSMVATAPARREVVTYWTRIGEHLPTSQSEQRLQKLETALAGFVPDGILVRCSSLRDDVSQSIQQNEQFLRDMVLAVAPEYRAAFVGSSVAAALAAARRS